MSFNFSQLQQSVDRLLINSSEAINKLVQLSVAPAQDITVQYYDNNGNLVTQTTPNLMKVLNTVQTNINSYMDKTLYVDPINGDDDNDGASQRPVRTIKRAVEDLVPVGGYGKIILKPGVHTLTSNVNIRAKTIVIELENNCTLTTNWYNSGGYSNIYSIRLTNNAFLHIIVSSNSNATILVPPKPNDLPASILSFAGFIQVGDTHISNISIRPDETSNFTVLINDVPFILNISGIANIILHFPFTTGNLDFNINNGFLVRNFVGKSISLIRIGTHRVLRKDGNIVYDPASGGVKNLKALLSGIIYHPNTNIPANYVVDNPADFGF